MNRPHAGRSARVTLPLLGSQDAQAMRHADSRSSFFQAYLSFQCIFLLVSDFIHVPLSAHGVCDDSDWKRRAVRTGLGCLGMALVTLCLRSSGLQSILLLILKIEARSRDYLNWVGATGIGARIETTVEAIAIGELRC